MIKFYRNFGLKIKRNNFSVAIFLRDIFCPSHFLIVQTICDCLHYLSRIAHRIRSFPRRHMLFRFGCNLVRTRAPRLFFFFLSITFRCYSIRVSEVYSPTRVAK
ncbi:hypothetical protein PUN28_018167 [Cardiocondyla obscurior]|uniref:Uncharacterized protein n=1 Tax=Cardiocondyla obscurior TaxID=286306 RepID=A0AAW2EIA5_9HYME